MSASNYLEDALLNATLANVAYTSPANVYLALYSTAPTDSSSGTELTGNGYSRQLTTFTVNTGNGIANSSANVSFTASGNNWPTVLGWAIVNANTSGNILYYSTLTPSQTVLDGNTLTINTGNIRISMD